MVVNTIRIRDGTLPDSLILSTNEERVRQFMATQEILTQQYASLIEGVTQGSDVSGLCAGMYNHAVALSDEFGELLVRSSRRKGNHNTRYNVIEKISHLEWGSPALAWAIDRIVTSEWRELEERMTIVRCNPAPVYVDYSLRKPNPGAPDRKVGITIGGTTRVSYVMGQ